MKLKHSVLLLLSSLLIIGCGLKGDLYTPEDKPVVVNEPTESTQKENSQEELGEEPVLEKDDLHYQPTESSVPQ